MSTSTTGVDGDALPYVEAVLSRVAGLPTERRAELVDDLRQHLTELAAEPGPPLAERLGPPAEFADEYLSSAGVEVPPARTRPRPVRTLRGWLRELGEHSAVRAVLDYLPELRPAWLVARGYLVVAAFAGLSDHDVFPFPDVGLPGGRFSGTLLALAAGAGSVALARAAAEGRRLRWDIALTGVGILAAGIVAIDGMGDGPNRDAYASEGDSYVQDDYKPPGQVISAEGTVITNLFVYDAQGNLLQGVYVFDQDGLPVSTPASFDPELRTTVPLDADGNVITNQYPQLEERILYGADGAHALKIPPPLPIIPRLPAPPMSPSTTIVGDPGPPAATTTTTLTPPPTTAPAPG
ncbi:MAG TPA: hypothetical protein VGJ86_01575 [Acidimicrobiales bacterium]|jgi:hypothetical protein